MQLGLWGTNQDLFSSVLETLLLALAGVEVEVAVEVAPVVVLVAVLPSPLQ